MDNSASANSLVTLLFSEEMFSSIAQRLLEIIHFCREKGTVHCLPVSELVYTIPTYEVVPGLKETTGSKED